jgi:hopene-associated glycosyltransferase HpnB
LIWLAIVGAVIWVVILILPWRPWTTREFLDSDTSSPGCDLSDITALIPARNEAEVIRATLKGLQAQGAHLSVILVDDQSTDGTAQRAEAFLKHGLSIVSGEPLPAGWSGKLWALQQGLRYVRTPLVLLIDADIELLPGILSRLRDFMRENGFQLVSLMASLRMTAFWERLLLPAFVYFFKLLYPFRLSNSSIPGIAAAAGGCVLVERRLLDEIGGFTSIRAELIDDCALARKVKSLGYRTWIGLTHSAHSLRAYDHLSGIWGMVARNAFAQLHYSAFLLALCTGLMIAAFVLPVMTLFLLFPEARFISALALGVMMLCYLPTLKFYGLSWIWSLALPLIGGLYLAMTWTSAIRYWTGKGSMWKDRSYKITGF